ncbi:MAG: hypothetical protein KAW40_03265 [Candidatus Aenigmarchaeota archaeon]|nr:hypothetical protein [Candidatus Aenigmarchaeota archaeon]
MAVPRQKKRIVKLKDLKHEFVTFKELDEDIQKKVTRDYIKAWEPVLYEEKRLGIIESPLEEEIWNRWNSELYTGIFLKGQMVLMAEIEGSWEPIRSIRSLIWRITKREILKSRYGEGTELEGVIEDQTTDILIKTPPETYPDTWNLATNYGHGYPRIQMIENGERKDYEGTDYEKVLNPKTKKEENKKHDLVLINYAVQEGGDLPEDIRIKGATKAIIKERGEFSEELGVDCDTYTPATGLPEYLLREKVFDEEFERKKEFYAKEYICENILPAAAGIMTGIRDAASMHLGLGANFVGYFLDARNHPGSKNVYIITSYSLQPEIMESAPPNL